jgi:hypothetical protein
LVRFDLRATVCGALDVVIPPLALERVRERAAARRRKKERRRLRTLRGAAALVAVLALFAAGYGPRIEHASAIAALPVPAPAPLAT